MLNIWPKELLNKREIEEFINLYARDDNWHHLDKKNGGLGYGWIHYSLIRVKQPQKILCIGSKWGYIPAVCALACKDNQKGRVDFVDAGYDIDDFAGPDVHWGGVGWWKKCNPKTYFGKFGLDKYLRLWVMKSNEFHKKFSKEKYGFVHIDGDHSYSGVKKDFEMFWPRVERGGFLAMHDIHTPDHDGNIYGTREFWQELKDSGKYQLMEIAENPGVGIIQKDY